MLEGRGQFRLSGGALRALRGRVWPVPVVLYALALALAHGAGFRMEVQWGSWQLLDRTALADHPWTSLYLLHCQPPGLNALLALLVRLSEVTGLRVETLAGLLFDGLGLVASLAMFDIGRRLTGSIALSALGVALMLADPAFHMLGHHFFYTFPVAVLLLLALRAAARYLEHGARGALWSTVLWLALLVLTRSLYHPAWALAFLALMLGLRRIALGRGDARRSARVALPAATLVLACCAWPAKNLLVFGEAVNTSWMGYYATLGLHVQDEALDRYVANGSVPDATSARLADYALRYGAERIDVIASPVKSDGSRNWNHLLFLETNDALLARSLAFRREHPGAWLRLALTRWLELGRPAYVHPYDGVRLLPSTVADGAWPRAVERALFADLRPLVERLARSDALSASAIVSGVPLPFTVFGLVLLPGSIALAACMLWRRRAHLTAREGTLLLALLTVVWVLFACLMLTEEGNRVRFPTTPLLVLIVLHAAHALGAPRASRR